MRAAEAARSTASLIDTTVKNVQEGVGLLKKASDAFTEVSGSTDKTGLLLENVDSASRELAQEIEQVNKAVSEMDKVVQQNAASAEESAAASEQMNAQSQQMRGVVNSLVSLVGETLMDERKQSQRTDEVILPPAKSEEAILAIHPHSSERARSSERGILASSRESIPKTPPARVTKG
jgi:hypothetical protein